MIPDKSTSFIFPFIIITMLSYKSYGQSNFQCHLSSYEQNTYFKFFCRNARVMFSFTLAHESYNRNFKF